jgi:hypothetical protein
MKRKLTKSQNVVVASLLFGGGSGNVKLLGGASEE